MLDVFDFIQTILCQFFYGISVLKQLIAASQYFKTLCDLIFKLSMTIFLSLQNGQGMIGAINGLLELTLAEHKQSHLQTHSSISHLLIFSVVLKILFGFVEMSDGFLNFAGFEITQSEVVVALCCLFVMAVAYFEHIH